MVSGFQYDLREVDRGDLEDQIIAANQDERVDGIIVYYPIYGNRQDHYLQQIPDVNKDVEGLNHRYIFNMYRNVRFLDEQQQQKSILVCSFLMQLNKSEARRYIANGNSPARHWR